MAKAQRYTARARIDLTGVLPKPNFLKARERAQEENARVLQKTTRALARSRIRGPRPGDKPKARVGGRMADNYKAFARNRGAYVELTNPLRRALWFEEGTRPHKISASPGAARGARGRFIKGKRLLYFRDGSGRLISKGSVNHPGQRGKWPMRDSIRSLEGTFERNLDKEFAKELS